MRTREGVTHVELVDEFIDGGLVASDVLGRWCHSYSLEEKNDVVDELFDEAGGVGGVSTYIHVHPLYVGLFWPHPARQRQQLFNIVNLWALPELEQVSHKVHAVRIMY